MLSFYVQPLEESQTVFQSGCKILHLQHYLKGPTSSQLCQHLLMSFFIIITVFLVGVKLVFVVQIFISLMTNDIEHVFMGLLSIYTSYPEKFPCFMYPKCKSLIGSVVLLSHAVFSAFGMRLILASQNQLGNISCSFSWKIC